MKANPLYPRIVEEYKSHLRINGYRPLSFSRFCLHYKIRKASLEQWMRRHGMNVTSLRCQVLSEGYRINTPESMQKTEKKNPSLQADALEGISITFPDGVIVNIRRTSAVGMIKFIKSYHRIIDRKNV